MFCKLAVVLVAARAVHSSNAGMARVHSLRVESTQLRGIANYSKHATTVKNASYMTGNHEVLLKYAVALRQTASHPARRELVGIMDQIIGFARKATELIAGVDEYNGYLGGLLLMQPGQELLNAWNAIGGVGLVYVSWAGLALGLKDDAKLLWDLMSKNGAKCETKIWKDDIQLMINVVGQGLGLASILGGGPIGGAVFGAISAGIGYLEGKLSDVIPGDCDKELKDYNLKNIEIVEEKELPRTYKLETNEITRVYDRKQMLAWTKETAYNVWWKSGFSKQFERNYYNGSSYEANGRNGMPTYGNDEQNVFN